MQYARSRWISWYLTKYLSLDVLFSFLFGTTIFLLILLMFQAIRLSEFIVVQQVGMRDVAKLCIFLMLSFLPIAVPIAFLFSVLMGISRANSEGEIIALQVSGISIKQIFSPLFIFSILVSLFCVYTALYTVPRGNRSFELLITKLSNEKVMSALKPGVFLDFHGLTLFAEQIIPLKNEMKRVFIYDEREENRPLAITAQAGVLRNRQEENILTLRLTNGSILVDRKKPDGVQQAIDFQVYDINLDLGGPGSAWREYSPPSYNFEQLKTRIEETKNDPPIHRQLKVELHRRFSLSLACLVFAGLGFFIGILSQRGIRSSAILLCMLVGLVYWLSYVGANALAINGSIPAWLGVWSPNFLFAGVAYGFYRRYVKK